MEIGTVLSVAENLVSALQSPEIREDLSILGYKYQLDELQCTVSTIRAVLRDAETKQEFSHQEQDLIEKLKDVVFEADDLFDEFLTLTKQQRLRKADGGFSRKLRNFFSSSKNQLNVSSRMSRGVKDIKKKLDAIAYDNQSSFKIDPEPTRNTDSDDNPSQNGLEEHGLTITPPEQRQSFPILTPESNIIQRQHSYDDNEGLIMRISRGVIFNKWLYRLLNVILEISQVTFTEVNDRRKMSDLLCYKLISIVSSICLLISVGEFIAEAKRSRVVYRRRGMCCWFYCPGIDGRLFGSLPLYFSVISSATQFCVNLAILLSKKRFFGADTTALLFAIVALFSPTKHRQGKTTEKFDHEV